MPSFLTRRFASAAASFDHEYIRGIGLNFGDRNYLVCKFSARFMTGRTVARVNRLAFTGHLLVDWICFSKGPLGRRRIAWITIEIGHALEKPRPWWCAKTERRIDQNRAHRRCVAGPVE